MANRHRGLNACYHRCIGLSPIVSASLVPNTHLRGKADGHQPHELAQTPPFFPFLVRTRRGRGSPCLLPSSLPCPPPFLCLTWSRYAFPVVRAPPRGVSHPSHRCLLRYLVQFADKPLSPSPSLPLHSCLVARRAYRKKTLNVRFAWKRWTSLTSTSSLVHVATRCASSRPCILGC